MDYARVRDFLKNLYHNWNSCSPTSRNRFLKLIIEAVELKTIDYDIEATIIWKTGFRQKIIIYRPRSNSKMEKRWTEEEDGLLKMLYPSASVDTIMAALPSRENLQGEPLSNPKYKMKQAGGGPGGGEAR